MMQVQVFHGHTDMATIDIVMKDKSPPSIMCTTTTDDIYQELKHHNDIIIMKMLDKRIPTSPKKLYITPSQSFKST